MQLPDHRLAFIGGLHRSGTTPLARCLARHRQVSGFGDTGVKEDEGQHLQSIYPAARDHGGPGRFALVEAAHLTEESDLATPAQAERLFAQWSPHWDLARPVLLEKSPPNLVMTRFLQALFPDAYFVIVVRHPVMVALSTRKWVGGSWSSLFEHWFHAHDTFMADASRLRRVHVLKYEDLVGDTRRALGATHAFLGLDGDIPVDCIEAHRSLAYEQQWQRLATSLRPWDRRVYRGLCRDYEERARQYGYSLVDLKFSGQLPISQGSQHPPGSRQGRESGSVDAT